MHFCTIRMDGASHDAQPAQDAPGWLALLYYDAAIHHIPEDPKV